MKNNNFNSLVKDYLKWKYEYNPELASKLGLKEYDNFSKDCSIEAIKEAKNKLLDFKKRAEKLKSTVLEKENYIDLFLLLNGIESSITSMEKIKTPEKNPSYYLASSIGGIHILMLKTFRKQEETGEAILKKMLHIPVVLKDGKNNLKACPPVFIKTAEKMAAFIPAFIDFVRKTYVKTLPSLEKDFEKASEKAKEALIDFKNFITEEITPGEENSFAAGEELFTEILKTDYLLDTGIEEIKEIANKNLEEINKNLVNLAKKIDPSKSWKEIYELLKNDNPPSEEIFPMYKNYIEELKDFISSGDIITLPEEDSLEVSEVPDYLKTIITIAGYFSPGHYDPVQKGIFWINSDNRKLHNYHTAKTMALHETYPGHHIQKLFANRQQSIIRREFSCSLTSEGWAVYCEELMKEEGFLDRPELLLVHEANKLMRNVRILIDTGLHTGNMTLEEGTELFINKALLSPDIARAEVEAYTRLPTQPLSYTMGQREILRLREDYKKAKGSSFSLKEFHEKFLSMGEMPLKLIRNVMFEEEIR